MTTERETLRLIGEWMEEGRTSLPDQLLDAVLEGLPSKPQRRPRWPARRISSMPSFAKYAIAAAAVVVVALVGFNLFGASTTSNVGGAASSTIPSDVPSSSPPPLVPETGQKIPAGRYRWTSPSTDVSFDLPDGWTGRPDTPGWIDKPLDGTNDYDLSFANSRHEDISVYGDACKQGDPAPIGNSVDDLVAALENQKSTDVIVSDIAAGSVTGKRIDVREAAGLDRSTCTDGANGAIRIWVDGARTDYFAWEEGHGVAYVFDVDGHRLVFMSGRLPDTAESDAAEVDAIVKSFEFSPH